MPWSAMPEEIRRAVEAELGAPVAEAVTQAWPRSPGTSYGSPGSPRPQAFPPSAPSRPPRARPPWSGCGSVRPGS